MAVPQEVVNAMLQQLPQFHASFGKGEIKVLPRLLNPNENIYGVIHGIYNGATWLVVATNTRLLFIDKDTFGDGFKQLTLPLDRVQGVAHKVGFGSGDVTITAAGAAWELRTTPKQSTQPFADVLQWLITNATRPQYAGAEHAVPQHPAAAPSPAAGNADPLAHLERLVQLRQAGMLTDQEFVAAKSRLLGL